MVHSLESERSKVRWPPVTSSEDIVMSSITIVEVRRKIVDEMGIQEDLG